VALVCDELGPAAGAFDAVYMRGFHPIPEVVDQYGVKFVLDVPSGDANWQFSFFKLDLLPMYVGLDVAQFPVELNQRRFAHHRNKLFARWDVSACALPRLVGTGSNVSMPFDLIISRDMIQHMPLQLGLRAVRNFARSGARFLLTTTFENFDNVDDDSKTDAFYANNLAKAPFNFPRPLKCKRSHPPEFDEHDLL